MREYWRSNSRPWDDLTGDRLVELGLQWVILAIAVWVAANLVDGISVAGLQSTLSVALILGLLNLYIRPLMRRVATPITVFTLGAFLILINAALLGVTSWIAGHLDGVQFHVSGIAAAVTGAIVISLVSVALRFSVNVYRLLGSLSFRWVRY